MVDNGPLVRTATGHPGAREVTKLIRKRFHVKNGDTLPYSGWYNSTRNDIVDVFAELGFTKGAEIGVCKGQFSEVMLQKVPNLKLFCIDPWTAYERVSQEKTDVRFNLTKKRLTKYDGAILVKTTSVEAVKNPNIPDGSLDFVFIDGLHDFDNVMLDLIYWSKKVRWAGIVAGHDYYKFYQSGIITAVNAYTYAHGVNEWYVTREKECSFFWVKQ